MIVLFIGLDPLMLCYLLCILQICSVVLSNSILRELQRRTGKRINGNDCFEKEKGKTMHELALLEWGKSKNPLLPVVRTKSINVLVCEKELWLNCIC